METLKLREDFIKLGQALKATWNGGKRRRSQACDPGWTGKGKRRCGDTKRQEAGSRGTW